MREPYAYPTPRTGTSQDLMTIVTRAHERRLEKSSEPLPAKSAAQRLWVEPPFILFGALMSKVLDLAGPERVLALHDRLYSSLARPYAYPFDPDSGVLRRAVRLARRLEAEAGLPPALISLVSHPPVAGEMAHLNFELVRHASLALRAMRGRPCRPRLVVAVDPFALDGIPTYKEGIYAGYMSRYHLGFDRLVLGHNALVRLLLRGASWDRIMRRILRRLNEGGEVGMVLAGGVPETTRALYAVREWVGRRRRESPLRARSREVLSALRRAPGFARFEAEGPHGESLRRSVWRMMEAWAMAAATGTFSQGAAGGPSSADTGRLDGPAREVLAHCLESLGLAPESRPAALEELADEVSRETPYRARFFELLARGVLARGRPLVLLPVAHRFQGGFGIEVKEAWSWEALARGRLRARRGGESPLDWEGTPAEFAIEFGRENFR